MSFFERLIDFNTKVNDFIWVKLGLILLLGTGMLMTLRTGGFQFRYIGHWLKNTVGSLFNKKVSVHSHEKASISQFQALCTALAATVGVGNIAGVAGAIAIGGPGAVEGAKELSERLPESSPLKEAMAKLAATLEEHQGPGRR